MWKKFIDILILVFEGFGSDRDTKNYLCINQLLDIEIFFITLLENV